MPNFPTSFSTLNYQHVAVLKALLALAATLLAVWWGANEHPPRRTRSLQIRTLTVIGILCLAGWWNFGRYHFSGGFYHLHEFFHYYTGAKYLPELGYTGIYDCAAAVEIEQGKAVEISSYWIRDLTTNEMRRGAETMERAAECKTHFTPERWALFKADTLWLFDHMTAQKRIEVLADHGYNPSPFWSVTGGWLANMAPMSWDQMTFLASIDPVLILLMFAAIYWAFGWEVLCFALVWWGTNYPSRYNYIGGAFLRQDWLLFAVASLCFARRGLMWAAGAALVWSAMLRVFPAFIVLGLALKILQQSWKARRVQLTRAQWQFAGGAVIALAVLFSISLTVGGEHRGLQQWQAFAANSRKHLATPVTNNIGLPTVVSFEPATRASRVSDYWVTSPWDAWKDARRRVFAERRVLYWGLVAAFVALLALAVRHEEDWVALVLGVGAIPILSDLASYYFSVLLAFALLWRRLPLAGIALALTAFVTAIIPGVLADDERYTAISVAYLVFITGVTAAIALGERRRAAAHSPVIDASSSAAPAIATHTR